MVLVVTAPVEAVTEGSLVVTVPSTENFVILRN